MVLLRLTCCLAHDSLLSSCFCWSNRIWYSPLKAAKPSATCSASCTTFFCASSAILWRVLMRWQRRASTRVGDQLGMTR